MKDETIAEIQKTYKERLAQLNQVGKVGNPHLMKQVDAKLNKEYKELLSEFHLVSAKLSLLKRLCGESQRLTKQAMKRKKRTNVLKSRAKAMVEEKKSDTINEEKK